MGCTSSSEAGNSRTTARPAERPEPVTIPAVSATPRSFVSPPSSMAYETELAASLVEGDGPAVAYHGILAGAGRLSLKRSTELAENKVFVKSVHPLDDSNTLEPSPDSDDISVITGMAMSMPYTVIVGVSSSEEHIKNIVTNVFEGANKIFNGWNPDSEISQLNQALPERVIEISPELRELFATIDDMCLLTKGRFDPTIGALCAAFENCIKDRKRPPLPSEVYHLKFGIGWHKRIKRKNGQVSRTNAHTVIDLDGISKGFIIDKLIAALTEEGYENVYVDWAGDVRASGNHPSGRSWRSAVLFPPALRRMFAHWQNGTLKEMLQSNDIGFYANFEFPKSEAGGAIATSGDYFSIQKYGYHHIADIEDLAVLKASQTSVASVCIAASTCAVADAIATATMTFKRVNAAIEFLNGIQAARPDLISGFCVMSRENPGHYATATHTSSIFVRASEESSSTTDTQAEDGHHESRVTEGVMDIGRGRISQNLAEVHFDNQSLTIDSLTPCSMEPEQFVTFASPASFVSNASTESNSDLNKLFVLVLGFRSDEAGNQETSVRIDMRFRKIVKCESSVLVVAAIEAIDLGSATTVEIPYHKGVWALRDIQLGKSRAAYGVSPLINQVKELFRQIPSIVWIIGTKTADQVEIAITATSVTVPQVLNNMLCFNITHSSTFFAGIGGLGSRIRGHALSIAQKSLADDFVKRSSLTLDDITALESASIVTTDCTVELVESVQDHIVVLARINDVRYVDSNLMPLQWLQGGYVNN